MLIASLFPEPVELPGVLLKEIRWGQITASSKPCVRAYLVTYSVKALAKESGLLCCDDQAQVYITSFIDCMSYISLVYWEELSNTASLENSTNLEASNVCP